LEKRTENPSREDKSVLRKLDLGGSSGDLQMMLIDGGGGKDVFGIALL
jgi:hypothetical protein